VVLRLQGSWLGYGKFSNFETSFEEQLGRKLFFLKQRYFLLCHGFVRTSVDLLSMSSGLVTEVINHHARFKFIRASCSVLLLFLVKPVSVIIDSSSQYGSNCILSNLSQVQSLPYRPRQQNSKRRPNPGNSKVVLAFAKRSRPPESVIALYAVC